MQISQAISERRSCRDFSGQKVERDTLRQLMRLATRAPSAINLQPWQFTVVMEEEVARLSRRLQKARLETGKGCAPDSRAPLSQVYAERKRELSRGMGPIMQEAGVDAASFIDQGSLDFYGAPATVICCLDRAFDRVRALDVGIAAGWLLLAAHDLGLSTCPIGLVAAYQDEVRDFLNIEDQYQVLLAVAVGYAEEDAPLNRFRSPRAGLDEVVRWY